MHYDIAIIDNYPVTFLQTFDINDLAEFLQTLFDRICYGLSLFIDWPDASTR
jgi:hypothetical protein